MDMMWWSRRGGRCRWGGVLLVSVGAPLAERWTLCWPSWRDLFDYLLPRVYQLLIKRTVITKRNFSAGQTHDVAPRAPRAGPVVRVGRWQDTCEMSECPIGALGLVCCVDYVKGLGLTSSSPLDST